jgi:AcrR family transcriptional regulator
MRADTSARPTAAERTRFEAAIVDQTVRGYLVVRALIAVGGETNERLARSTAMGREFVAEVRRRVAEGKSAALFTEKPSTVERMLDAATEQIVAARRSEVAIDDVSATLGIPRRTLFRHYSASKLLEACQCRATTIWRARFERDIQRVETSAAGRLFSVVDAIAAWVTSEQFYGDQVLRPPPLVDGRGGELREHMAALERFAIDLAQKADVAGPREFGTFVAINVVGAVGWVDRVQEARSLAIAFVERLTGAPRPN